jgi:antitoxin PrlF
MTTILEETSRITAKGQTTVPKAVRQALGVDYGGMIAYRIEGGRVTVRNPAAEHRDPALAAFLGLIEKESLPAATCANCHPALPPPCGAP